MANFTPNVNLEKPLGSEHYLIPKFNANMDKIDVKLGDLSYVDRIAYIAEKIRNRNLVKNGDFSDGTIGWSGIGGSISVTDNELSLTATTEGVDYVAQSIPSYIVGNKYYFRTKQKANDASVSELSQSIGGALGQSLPTPTIGQMYTLSSVVAILGATNIRVRFSVGTGGVGKNIGTIKQIISIDLTTLFGTGNEPTKAEMDAAIELLGGWTDVPMADKYLTGYNLGTNINALTSKTTPVDADMVVITDSAATNVSKKLTWSNIKTTLKSYFDGLYATIANLNLKASIANPTFTGLITTGGQIKFPATQVPSADPNTLDDYEEGSFTPTVTTVGLAISVVRNAKYIKIGKFVSGIFYVDINNTSGVSKVDIEFGGLPFVADGWNFAHKTFGANSALAQCYVENSSNKIYTSSDNISTGVTSNMYYFSYIATV